MAAVANAPGLPQLHIESDSDSQGQSQNSQGPAGSPSLPRSNSTSPHPDLNSEVATLSNKLITAINYQTTLDDTLAATRHELQSSQERVRELEAASKKHSHLIASGLLIRKPEVERESAKLVAKLTEEKKQRSVVEQEKKGIEQELVTLTTALFEEANQMVAGARKEREAAERRIEQLRAQLNDTELLLASHQEQLAELKTVMQQMSLDRDDADANTNASSAPLTPALPSNGELSKIFDALHLSPVPFGTDEIPPGPPTSFSHLICPVLRTDLQSYDDFRTLLQVSRNSAPPSRVSSGSYGGLNVMGLNGLQGREQNQHLGHLPSHASTTSLSTPPSFSSSSNTTPSTPASSVSAMPLREITTVPLKETRFYKRALAEDIEPTLRLDTAPGLSWLARRTVINSMSEGSLVVEPMPASAKLHIFTCALCGENRKDDQFARTHRFRTSESETAQRYPLCNYCLNRIRASCDFLGFLRMIKDGHWRIDGFESEKGAWEESVRLRERMFWARIGGGVVPAFLQSLSSPRPSTDNPSIGSQPMSAPPILCNDIKSRKEPSENENEDLSRSRQKRILTGERVLSHGDISEIEDDWETAKKAAIFDDDYVLNKKAEVEVSKQLRTDLRNSLNSNPPFSKRERSDMAISGGEQGLQITIPGAFELCTSTEQ